MLVIFLSLSSSPLKPRAVIILATAAFAAANCAAEPTFLPVEATPYDHQMRRINSALRTSAYASRRRISLATINRWMTQLREVPYRYSKRWKTPAEVSSGEAADCKGKAVVIYQRLRKLGARKVWFVIGRRCAGDARTHAWVEWRTSAGDYVLDPTFNSAAKKDPGSGWSYIPLYAYDGAQKYRALDASFLTQN